MSSSNCLRKPVAIVIRGMCTICARVCIYLLDACLLLIVCMCVFICLHEHCLDDSYCDVILVCCMMYISYCYPVLRGRVTIIQFYLVLQHNLTL